MIQGHINAQGALAIGLLSALTFFSNRLFNACYTLHFSSPLLAALPLTRGHHFATRLVFQAYIHAIELPIFLLAFFWACISTNAIFSVLMIAPCYLFSLVWGSLLVNKTRLSLATQYLVIATLNTTVLTQSWFLFVGFVAWVALLQKLNTRLALNTQLQQFPYLTMAIAKSTNTPQLLLASLVLIVFSSTTAGLNLDLLVFSLSFLVLALANNGHLKTVEYFRKYRQQLVYMPLGEELLKRYCYRVSGVIFLCIAALQLSVWYFLHPSNLYLTCWTMSLILGAFFALASKKYQLISQFIFFSVFFISYLS